MTSIVLEVPLHSNQVTNQQHASIYRVTSWTNNQILVIFMWTAVATIRPTPSVSYGEETTSSA